MTTVKEPECRDVADRQAIYTKTAKGLREVAGKTHALSRDLRNILKKFDGKTPASELLKTAGDRGLMGVTVPAAWGGGGRVEYEPFGERVFHGNQCPRLG